jgi:membrane protein YqaA with SNARE-associated domain
VTHPSGEKKGLTLTEPTLSADSFANSPASKPGLNWKHILGRLGAVVLALGLTVVIAYFASQVDIEQLRRYGYLGAFLAGLIANATIALPVPGVAVTMGVAVAMPGEWWLVALVAAAGEALGESTAYLAGYGGSAVIENKQIYQRLHYWMERYGAITVFVLSAIPNPFIDLAGITAGASEFGYPKFLLFCWLGKSVKSLVACWAAVHSAVWLLHYFGPG